MPARIQRKRTKGWRLPPGAVIVDRTSRFGNPFRIADAIDAKYSNPRRAVVAFYRAWLNGSPDLQDVYVVGGRTYDRRRVLADLPLLRGRDLACPCPPPEPGEPDHCHGAVLLAIANSPAPKETPGA